MEKRRWTQEEELIILDCVKKSPENLQYAFREASIKINRTFRATVAHYYKIRHKYGTLFMLTSNNTATVNTKNAATTAKHIKKYSSSNSIFNKILKLFKLK